MNSILEVGYNLLDRVCLQMLSLVAEYLPFEQGPGSGLYPTTCYSSSPPPEVEGD